MTVPPLALSREGTAKACGVSVSTVDRAVRDGFLTPVRFGRRVLFLVADVAAALEDAKRRGEVDENYNRPEDAETIADLADDDPEIEKLVAELDRQIAENAKIIREALAEMEPPDRAKTVATMMARVNGGRKGGAK